MINNTVSLRRPHRWGQLLLCVIAWTMSWVAAVAAATTSVSMPSVNTSGMHAMHDTGDMRMMQHDHHSTQNTASPVIADPTVVT